MNTAVARRRFTVDEYYRMAEAGILGPDERVELIEGEIIEMAAIGSRHAGCVNRLNRILVRGAGDRGLVTVQNPVHLSDFSEPQPDLALVRSRPDDYAESHPTPADVLLLIEVADSSAGFDRGAKAPLYAASGVPEYWLVDIATSSIEVYRDPAGRRYRKVTPYRAGDVLRAKELPGLAVPVDDVLG